MLTRLRNLYPAYCAAPKMLMTEGSTIRFEPIEENVSRMLNFSGGCSLSAYEVSCWLHDIAERQMSQASEQGQAMSAKVNKIENSSNFNRLYSLVIDSEYRNGRKFENELAKQFKHLGLCLSTMERLISTSKDVPVATASNMIYAAGQLGLKVDLTVYLSILSSKLTHLHGQGILEALSGLHSLKHSDKTLTAKLIEELKKRDFQHTRVTLHRWSHIEYVPINELGATHGLLKALGSHSDPAVQKIVQGIS